MKTKKLVKKALKKTDLFSEGELFFFKKWLKFRKQAKTAKINKSREEKN